MVKNSQNVKVVTRVQAHWKCSKKFVFLWFLHLECQCIPLLALIHLNFTLIVHFSIFESKTLPKKLKSICSHQLLHAFILLNSFMFKSYEHFSKGILEEMIPHCKALLSNFQNQELNCGCISYELCSTVNTNRSSLWPTLQ